MQPFYNEEKCRPLPSALGRPVAVIRSAFDEWPGRVEDTYVSCCGFSGIVGVAVLRADVDWLSDALRAPLALSSLHVLVLQGRCRQGSGIRRQGRMVLMLDRCLLHYQGPSGNPVGLHHT